MLVNTRRDTDIVSVSNRTEPEEEKESRTRGKALERNKKTLQEKKEAVTEYPDTVSFFSCSVFLFRCSAFPRVRLSFSDRKSVG